VVEVDQALIQELLQVQLMVVEQVGQVKLLEMQALLILGAVVEPLVDALADQLQIHFQVAQVVKEL
jgi:hypothetical protein